MPSHKLQPKFFASKSSRHPETNRKTTSKKEVNQIGTKIKALNWPSVIHFIPTYLLT